MDQAPPASAPMPPRVYANIVQGYGGAWDLALDFGYQISETDRDWQVRVVVSWEHAKALHTILGNFVRAYEQQVGEIPQPDMVQEARHD